jgi:beta-lactamase regulating signal transducer with metallopeptidase domain
VSHTAALLLYGALLGVVAPAVLRRARWIQRVPVPAIGVWFGLGLSFIASLALLVHHLVAPGMAMDDGMPGLLHACEAVAADVLFRGPSGGTAQLLGPVAVALWPLGWYGFVLLRARWYRRRHAAMLNLVARPDAGLAALVVEHPVPAVYCLPGRRSRVVLTRGALAALSPAQVHAVLAHERAHLRGRHHLVTAAVEAFARAFPRLPLARAARTEVAVLLEMAADDRAARTHAPRELAAAMCEVATGQVPGYSLGAAETAVVVRVKRLLHPGRTPHPIASVSVAAFALAVPFLPFVFSCVPTLH